MVAAAGAVEVGEDLARRRAGLVVVAVVVQERASRRSKASSIASAAEEAWGAGRGDGGLTDWLMAAPAAKATPTLVGTRDRCSLRRIEGIIGGHAVRWFSPCVLGTKTGRLATMLIRWVRRLLGAGAGRSTPVSRHAAPPGNPSRHPPMRRRPLLDRTGRIAGQECLAPPQWAPSIQSALGLLRDARAGAARPTGAGQTASAVSPASPAAASDGLALVAWAAVAGIDAALPADPARASWPGQWVTLPSMPPGRASDPAQQAWRRGGALLGVRDRPPEACSDVDFVHLRAVPGGLDTLRLAVQRWQEARRGLPIVVTGLETLEDIERMLASGVRLAGGRLDCSAAPLVARTLQPAAHRICVLLNDLALDHDTAQIAATIRADLNLAWRLLRVANSPALGLARRIESIDQAVTLLGRNELRRWLGVLLLAAGEGRPAGPALQLSALVRARLLETLAHPRPMAAADAAPSTLFTLGLLAQLPLLLQVPPALAFEPLRLAGPLRQALLERRGPLSPHIALLDVLEGDDEAALALAAQPWGGVAVVNEALREAWAWAESAALAAQ
jgi:hypothetical protein